MIAFPNWQQFAVPQRDLIRVCPAPRSREAEVDSRSRFRSRQPVVTLNREGVTSCQTNLLDRLVFEGAIQAKVTTGDSVSFGTFEPVGLARKAIVGLLAKWNQSDEWEPVRHGRELLN